MRVRFHPYIGHALDVADMEGVSAVPRTIRDQRFDTRKARKKLKPAGKPHYRLLDKGVHFGYRKCRSGGSWVVRVYKGNQQYVVETIGQADDGASDADGERILDFAQGQAKSARSPLRSWQTRLRMVAARPRRRSTPSGYALPNISNGWTRSGSRQTTPAAAPTPSFSRRSATFRARICPRSRSTNG